MSDQTQSRCGRQRIRWRRRFGYEELEKTGIFAGRGPHLWGSIFPLETASRVKQDRLYQSDFDRVLLEEKIDSKE